MSRSHKSTILFVLIVTAMDTAGLGIIYPVLPQLIQDLINTDVSSAATYGGWLTFAYALMQFVFAPVLGNLSDRHGRRIVLLISLLGFAIDCLFLAFAQHIIWLFIGRFIAGIAGASYSVASACIADISNDENRTENFGYINAAYSSGLIIGPVIGGLLGQFGTHIPFIAAAILSFGNFIFGYFMFPETLEKKDRRKFEVKRANPYGAFKHLSKFPAVITLIVAMFFVAISGHSMPSVWAYFTIEKFDWDTRLIGYSLAFLGVLSIVVQSWLVRLLAKKFGDAKMTIFGLLSSICGLLLIAFSAVEWLLFPAMMIYVIGSVQRTGFQSIITSNVAKNEQGELQGSLSSLLGLSTIIAPPLLTMAFTFFTKDESSGLYFPGTPYLIAVGLTVISLLIMIKKYRSI
ncbi:TCR/Tet family MFS transporter [Galbibacter pacificus]|uniref:TCR/Tet family MFS transporter n=1 Tax=Galbibacter pacificus TaxID=2996052 RepID=A0ABT6FWJ2_9FLAO|nr:TCR/Tet family MFS transporter [Galbibacter pacificus]MDG3584116.1 TCR/Tet family MFS transporter [Galbibacter pacificus]MDG3587451.1 TCR/Tet family MFS transporter [Galbibacter pacificus]